jgi:hypothetical protein
MAFMKNSEPFDISLEITRKLHAEREVEKGKSVKGTFKPVT